MTPFQRCQSVSRTILMVILKYGKVNVRCALSIPFDSGHSYQRILPTLNLEESRADSSMGSISFGQIFDQLLSRLR